MCPRVPHHPLRGVLAYLLVTVLLQVAGSRESALEPSQIPPTPWREEEGFMDLPGSVPWPIRASSAGRGVLAMTVGTQVLGQKNDQAALVLSQAWGGQPKSGSEA